MDLKKKKKTKPRAIWDTEEPNDDLVEQEANDYKAKYRLPFPAIIHQTWKTNRIPFDWKPSQDAWRKLFPTLKYRLWTDVENRKFMRKHYPEYLSLYDNWEYAIQRADMIRYFLLDYYGGGYCDLDNMPLKNFLSFFRNTNCEAYFVCQHMTGVTNALMFSKPGAGIWKCVFDEMMRSAEDPYYKMLPKHYYVMNTTGPMMLSRVVKGYQEQPIGILPVNFNPHPKDEGDEDEPDEQAPSQQLFMGKLRSGSWHSWDSKFVEHIRKNTKVYILLAIICIVIGLIVILKVLVKSLFHFAKTFFVNTKQNIIG
jgi:mannosyltransferase OCH1-like enzyme